MAAEMTIAATMPAPGMNALYPRFLMVSASPLGLWSVTTEAIDEQFARFSDATKLFCELVDPRLCRDPVEQLSQC